MGEFVLVDGHYEPVRTYTWGPSLGGGIGGLLSITDHSDSAHPATYYPFYDGNGNVMGLTNSSGAVVASYEYDPFGNLLDSTGPAADVNPFLFSTKYYDKDTRLYDYGLRYYSPELQRWLSRDPIQEDGGLNVYAFVGNDPVNFVDPVGLEVKGRGHMYPLFLGGSNQQPVFELTKEEHTKMHDFLRKLGFYSDTAEEVRASQKAWKALSEGD